jgi:hypothetical protein
MAEAKQHEQGAGDFMPLWISFEQARREVVRQGVPAELAGAVVRDAVQDDVPSRFTVPGGQFDEVAPEDRRRLMIATDTGRAWLMGAPSSAAQPVTASEPQPVWGNPLEVKSPALREHIRRLVPQQPNHQAQHSKGKRGRAPDDAKLPALMAAIQWLYLEGKPKPMTLLMDHIKRRLEDQEYRLPDDRTIRTWAEEFCQFWDKLLSTSEVWRN